MSLHLILILCLGFAALAPFLQRLLGHYGGRVLCLFPLGLTVFLGLQIEQIQTYGAIYETVPWVESMGIHLSFYLDSLSLLFSLLITGMGTFVLLYTSEYMADHPQLPRFYLLLLLFMGSMLGLVWADNLLVLFVFWEMTSLCSFFLIGFLFDKADARGAAKKALLATSIGSFIMLAGFLVLGMLGGSLEISQLIAGRADFIDHSLLLPLTICIGVGAVTKSAQFPFHFWLPGAMAAPSPVSAYLHSATMVKAGIYLLARLSPMFGGNDTWHYLVTLLGMFTVVMAAGVALWQTDLKRILAYSTICALGILTMLLGMGRPGASSAAMTFMLAHALYKGALFLVAGTIDHKTGTRDILKLGGLNKKLPFTTIAAVLAGLSMASVPPMLGFIAKEMILDTLLQGDLLSILCLAAMLFAGMAFVSISGLVVFGPFFGPSQITPKAVSRDTWVMWLGPLLLGLASLTLLLWPSLDSLLTQAGLAIDKNVPVTHLQLWHGLTLPLGFSLFTLVGGLFFYQQRTKIRGWGQSFDDWFHYSPSALYYIILNKIYNFANWQTQRIQNGSGRSYLRTIMGFALLMFVYISSQLKIWPESSFGLNDIYLYELVIFLLIMGGAWATIRAGTKIKSVVGIGAIGYSIALLYMQFSAPDLALTQFVIETLMVIIIIPIFARLPHLRIPEPKSGKLRDAVIAISFGSAMTCIVLLAQQNQWFEKISVFYTENSHSQAFGRNVVNVILVDFRGLDTMGEITVLAAAGIGVYALLKLRPGKNKGV